MELFEELIGALARCPAWVPLIALPAATVAAALLFTLLGGRRAYPFIAAVLGAAGFALMCCMGELSRAFVYLGLFAALAALCRLLFFFPRPRRRKGSTREERIYERCWGWDGEGSSSVVAEHIKRIRAKLMQAGVQGQIETVWGVGYKWVK